MALILLFVSSIARAAEPPAPPAAADKDAKPAAAAAATEADAHLQRARHLFSDQKFAEAAEELQRAFAFSPKPIFLFNAGQAYRKAEKYKEAKELYEHYLELAPDGPLASEARGNVSALDALLKAQQGLEDVSLRLETERSQLESQKKKTAEIEEELKKERSKRRWYRHPGFIAGVTIAGGLVLLGGIAALAVRQLSKTDGGTISIHF